MLPERIDHFRILGKIGTGGMGEVYRAHDERLDRPVAIKVVRPHALDNAKARERFLREAQATARLDHPSIVRIHQLAEWQGRDCIVMELVQGVSLRQALRQRSFDYRDALHIGIQVADGLAAAHGLGLVHRDLKAENVMFTPEGSAKILDFGLVKELEKQNQSESRAVVGTLYSMSPEQAQGRPVDHRTDLFSLGVLLYELATGSPPFLGTDGSHTLTLLLTHRPKALHRVDPRVPEELSSLVAELLEKNPAKRPADAARVRARLEEIASESADTAPVDGAVERLDESAGGPRDTRHLLSDLNSPTLVDGQPLPSVESEISTEMNGRREARPLGMNPPAEEEPPREEDRSKPPHRLRIALVALVLFAATLLTAQLVRNHRSGEGPPDFERVYQVDRAYQDGITALLDQDPRRAERHFQAALDIDPKHLASSIELVHALWRLGRDLEAQAKARDLGDTADGDNPAAGAASLIVQQDWKALIPLYGQVAEGSQGTLRELYVYRLATAHLELGQKDDVERLFTALPAEELSTPHWLFLQSRLLELARPDAEPALSALIRASELRLAGTGKDRFWARCELSRAKLLQEIGRNGEARSILEEIATWLGAQNDPRIRGEQLELRALERALADDKPEVALRLMQEAIDIYRSIGHQRGVARALGSLGNLLVFGAEWSRARDALLEAREAARGIGSRRDEMIVANALGVLAMASGELGKAGEYFDEAATAAAYLGDSSAEGRAAVNLSEVARREGDLDGAEASCLEAISLHETVNARADLVYDDLVLARIKISRGDLLAARETVTDALMQEFPPEMTYEKSFGYLVKSWLDLDAGDPQGSRQAAETAEELLRNSGYDAEAAEAQLLLVKAAVRLEELAEAERWLDKARGVIEATGDARLEVLLRLASAEVDLLSDRAPRRILTDVEDILPTAATVAAELEIRGLLLAAEIEKKAGDLEGNLEAARRRLEIAERKAAAQEFTGLAEKARSRLRALG